MKHVFAALLCLFCLPSFATGISYSFAEATYDKVDFDGTDLGIDGFSVGISGQVAPSIFLGAGFSHSETDDFTVLGQTGSLEFRDFYGSFGLRHGIANNVEITGEAALLHSTFNGTDDFAIVYDDEFGYGLRVGIRGLLTKQFELGANITRVAIFDETSISYGAQALLHVAPLFSILANYSVPKDGDASAISIGARLHFSNPQ